MAKYGIGARVKDRDGDEAEIIGKPSKGQRRVRYIGSDTALAGVELCWAKNELTPLPDNDNAVAPATAAPGAWVPKVGDRVLVVKHCNFAGAPILLHAPIGSEHEITKICHHFDDKNVPTFELSEGGHNFYVPENVELVKPPTIQAGKFYRTRDGRKVGPMVSSASKGVDSAAYPWAADVGYSFDADYPPYWREDGSFSPYRKDHAADLVAEWVEPAEVAVAPATATPKFKAGDKVRALKSTRSGDYKKGEIYEVREYSENADGYRHIRTVHDANGNAYNGWCADNFEPAAPPAKFKVGDRVRYTGTIYSRPCFGTVDRIEGRRVYCNDWSEGGKTGWLAESDLVLASEPTFTPGATVTFTATGRVSALNENGHVQITFPNLLPGQNSFALPAKYVALAN